MDNTAPNFGSIAHAISFLACDDIVETFYAKVCVSYHIKSSCLLRFWFASCISSYHIKRVCRCCSLFSTSVKVEIYETFRVFVQIFVGISNE